MKMTPARRIRRFCKECDGNIGYKGVKECPDMDCPIYKFRLGKGAGRSGLLKAIREKCLDCSCGNRAEVKNCKFTDLEVPPYNCPLYIYRFGHRPIKVPVQAVPLKTSVSEGVSAQEMAL